MALSTTGKLGDEDFTYVEMNHDDVEFMENNMNTSFHQNTKMPPWFNIDDDDVTVKMIQKENARLKKHKAYVKKKNQAQKRPKKTNFNDFKNGLCVSIKPKSRNPSQRFSNFIGISGESLVIKFSASKFCQCIGISGESPVMTIQRGHLLLYMCYYLLLLLLITKKKNSNK